MIYFKARKEKAMKRRFLLSSILIISMLFVTGCGKEEGKEDTTSTSSQVTEASEESTTEESINDYFGKELEKADQKYKDAIKDYTVTYIDGKIYAYIDTTSGGMIAEAADFSTKVLEPKYQEAVSFALTIHYEDPSGYIVSWDSEDNKTGFLVNTLTNYSESNVTVDGLYSWKEGK